jgi:hypothetical protein
MPLDNSLNQDVQESVWRHTVMSLTIRDRDHKDDCHDFAFLPSATLAFNRMVVNWHYWQKCQWRRKGPQQSGAGGVCSRGLIDAAWKRRLGQTMETGEKTLIICMVVCYYCYWWVGGCGCYTSLGWATTVGLLLGGSKGSEGVGNYRHRWWHPSSFILVSHEGWWHCGGWWSPGPPALG